MQTMKTDERTEGIGSFMRGFVPEFIPADQLPEFWKSSPSGMPLSPFTQALIDMPVGNGISTRLLIPVVDSNLNGDARVKAHKERTQVRARVGSFIKTAQKRRPDVAFKTRLGLPKDGYQELYVICETRDTETK